LLPTVHKHCGYTYTFIVVIQTQFICIL
jgi:hypothetical protein